MQLINLEKYLDSPTTSCDSTSNVHDCYILLPTKIHQYFETFPEGDIVLTDVLTKNKYTCSFTKGREFRINQFRQYINDKNITMGDKITLSIVRNNDDNISFYIDVEYTNFFIQNSDTPNLYQGFLTEQFENMFNDVKHIQKIRLIDNTELEIEKNTNGYIINGINLKKFILKEQDGIFSIVKLSSPQIVENEPIIVSGISSECNENGVKEQFEKYINSLELMSKKIPTRIKYLDQILPEKINPENPKSLFLNTEIYQLKEITKQLSKGGEYYSWDREGLYAGEILQTVNMYIRFLESQISMNDLNILSNENNEEIIDALADLNFQTFLKKITKNNDFTISDKITNNIKFIIGQPNTGKSYNFEESQIFNVQYKDNYKYLKIPVSGGIGNEYKGLQNTDLAITFDPIKKKLKFGEFLQVLMSAIANPKVPHVVFLDDFHNQDISSLLSEYTPLFKSQQKRTLKDIEDSHEIFNPSFSSTDVFIDTWNKFIESHCNKDINDKEVPKVPLTNRISGNSLKLVFPSNFYLLGAANFNENTLNIFADWEDRAEIAYKDPIESFIESEFYEKYKEDKFLICCLELNENLKNILKSNSIFDDERYCFGLWKIATYDHKLIDESDRIKTFKFFLGMVKNALKFNNKNSEINTIGWNLLVSIKNNDWIKENILDIANIQERKDLALLHKYNIYEDEI